MAAGLVYIVSRDSQLWSFEPDKKQFTAIGLIGCNAPSGSLPNAIAVDRNAIAWVNYVASDSMGNYTAGWVYKVSTADASCQAPPTFTLPGSWYGLGMAFSTDTVGGTAETLYVTSETFLSATNPGLGKLDFSQKSLIPIGQFTGDSLLTGQLGDLTGTGDARLFGFFGNINPVRVAQMDKTANILSDTPVSGVSSTYDWASSFWGGAFYLFSSDDIANSTVTRFDATTKSVDTSYVLTAPGVIYGAAASTCAPLSSP
jgi:hypothetical protein